MLKKKVVVITVCVGSGRGPDVPQMVKDECYDAELYEWTKVDIKDEAQKNLVNAYFEEPDEINGEKLLEAKCFK